MFVSPFSWYSFQGYLLNVHSWKKNTLLYMPKLQFERVSTYLATLRITVCYFLTYTTPVFLRHYFTIANCRGQVEPGSLQSVSLAWPQSLHCRSWETVHYPRAYLDWKSHRYNNITTISEKTMKGSQIASLLQEVTSTVKSQWQCLPHPRFWNMK